MKFVPLLLIVLLPAPAVAAPPCDDLAATLVLATDAKFVRKSETFGNVFLQHPAASEMEVLCGPGDAISVSIARDGSPTADYLRLIITAAAFVGREKDPHLGKKIVECLKAARAAPNKSLDIETDHLELGCMSFVESGGGNVVTLAPRKPPSAKP